MTNKNSNYSFSSKTKNIKNIFNSPDYKDYKEKKVKTQKRKETIYKITSINSSTESVKYLIIANVIIFIVSFYLIPNSINDFALYNITNNSFQPWQIITSMFLHGSIMHILFNMLALYSIGNAVVQTIGDKKFLQLYFLSGIIGGILCMLFCYSPVVGASGAICGVLSAMAILAPDTKIYLFFVIPLNLRKFTYGFMIFSLIFGVLSMINPAYGFGVAHFGHLGGLIGGYALTYYWKKKHNYTLYK
jgi:membrane associated rhomboid family serine protease